LGKKTNPLSEISSAFCIPGRKKKTGKMAKEVRATDARKTSGEIFWRINGMVAMLAGKGGPCFEV
jgi:hypothetical protein